MPNLNDTPNETKNEDATDQTPTVGTDRADDNESDPEGTESLGDAGKKALDAMKAERKALRQELRELKAKFEATTAPKPSEDKTDADAIRSEAKREATKAANERILKAEIRAAAAGKLADAADAFKFLNLSEFEVNDNGEIDADEISEAIADLVKSKPYLAAEPPKRFQGSADGGARNAKPGPSQLSRADLARMSDAEISAARKEGRLDRLMGRAN